MIYVFEDKESSVLSKFFRLLYEEEYLGNIIYSGGNSGTSKVVKRLLSSGESGYIVVFLDMVPGNSNIIKEYFKLSKLSRRSGYKVIVIPIVCVEYHFICSSKDSGIFFDREALDICCNKKPYFNSPILVSDLDRKYCTSFERYCKLMLKKRVSLCIKDFKKFPMKVANDMYNYFFTENCLCSKSIDSCSDSKIEDKCIAFLKEFPCVPEGVDVDGSYEMSIDDLWDKHRKLIDGFNSWVDILYRYDPDVSRAELYQHVEYIK